MYIKKNTFKIIDKIVVTKTHFVWLYKILAKTCLDFLIHTWLLLSNCLYIMDENLESILKLVVYESIKIDLG